MAENDYISTTTTNKQNIDYIYKYIILRRIIQAAKLLYLYIYITKHNVLSTEKKNMLTMSVKLALLQFSLDKFLVLVDKLIILVSILLFNLN